MATPPPRDCPENASHVTERTLNDRFLSKGAPYDVVSIVGRTLNARFLS